REEERKKEEEEKLEKERKRREEEERKAKIIQSWKPLHEQNGYKRSSSNCPYKSKHRHMHCGGQDAAATVVSVVYALKYATELLELEDAEDVTILKQWGEEKREKRRETKRAEKAKHKKGKQQDKNDTEGGLSKKDKEIK
ncbi:hypothetical protein ADUPG1_013184, partial [Aduncisulcus paluster]